ncbi:hypothetical protein M758_8G045600 [Ceratodon purpureus]|nr:hypothetical protein M758_8G045600 [Ceratodon purpureus]
MLATFLRVAFASCIHAQRSYFAVTDTRNSVNVCMCSVSGLSCESCEMSEMVRKACSVIGGAWR